MWHSRLQCNGMRKLVEASTYEYLAPVFGPFLCPVLTSILLENHDYRLTNYAPSSVPLELFVNVTSGFRALVLTNTLTRSI
jgi:hypothetical protein